MRRRKRKREPHSTQTPIHLQKETPFPQGPEIMYKNKESPKIRRQDMAKFAPSKAKRPANLWALLPSTKSMETTTTTTTRIADPRVTDTTTTVASTCRMCKRWGLPCPFCTQSGPHPSPVESDWSDEDWNREKQRAKEEEKKKQEPQVQQKEDLTKDCCPYSPVYDPTFKQDPLPHCIPEEKMALDPNYYLQGYVPEEQEKDDAPLLMNNLVNP